MLKRLTVPECNADQLVNDRQDEKPGIDADNKINIK